MFKASEVKNKESIINGASRKPNNIETMFLLTEAHIYLTRARQDITKHPINLPDFKAEDFIRKIETLNSKNLVLTFLDDIDHSYMSKGIRTEEDDSVISWIQVYIDSEFKKIEDHAYGVLIETIDKMIKEIEDEIEVIKKA